MRSIMFSIDGDNIGTVVTGDPFILRPELELVLGGIRLISDVE